MSVSELLEAAADLLRGSMFASLLEDVLGDEAVSVGESAERFGGPGVGGLIAGEAWGQEGLDEGGDNERMGVRTFEEGHLEVWRPYCFGFTL